MRISIAKTKHHIGLNGLMNAGLFLAVACACLLIHASIPNGAIAEKAIIIALLLGQFIAISILKSGDYVVAAVMLASLLIKLTAGWFQLMSAQWSTSDELMYYEQGRQLALAANHLGDIFSLNQLSGINFGTSIVIDITACIFKALGPSLPIAMILFSVFGFWGQYFYYLTFRQLFPNADRLYAAFGIFCLPSIIFWTADVGKDALMIFFLGLASYSVSISSQRRSFAIALLSLASFGACLVRPHIGVLLIISIVAAFSLVQGDLRSLKPRKRVIRMAILACIAFCLVYLCAQFLQLSNIAEALNHVDMSMQTNQQDGSGFDPGSSLLVRILLAPLLVIRPFPWETSGIAAVLASLEGMSIFALFVFYRKQVGSLMMKSSGNRCLTFIMWFVALNVLLLGIGTSNFGLLVRERVMILPMLMLTLAASPWLRSQLRPRYPSSFSNVTAYPS